MCPKNASYYGNRAATLMMLGRYREALEDSQQAVRLDNSFMKAGGGKQTVTFYIMGNLLLCCCTLLYTVKYILFWVLFCSIHFPYTGLFFFHSFPRSDSLLFDFAVMCVNTRIRQAQFNEISFKL